MLSFTFGHALFYGVIFWGIVLMIALAAFELFFKIKNALRASRIRKSNQSYTRVSPRIYKI
jgi:hypothetical protein